MLDSSINNWSRSTSLPQRIHSLKCHKTSVTYTAHVRNFYIINETIIVAITHHCLFLCNDEESLSSALWMLDTESETDSMTYFLSNYANSSPLIPIHKPHDRSESKITNFQNMIEHISQKIFIKKLVSSYLNLPNMPTYKLCKSSFTSVYYSTWMLAGVKF